MTDDDIHVWAAEAQALMRERLGLRGADLAAQVARAGRLLPRAVAREARYLAQATALAQNPKLMRMIDTAKAQQAHARLTAYLRGVNRAERRRTRALGILGVIAFNLLVLALLVALWIGLWVGLRGQSPG